MAVMTSSVPQPKKLSIEEYWQFPDDGRRHEIIDGVHFVNPPPEPLHQCVSRRIQFQLFAQIEEHELGEVFNAPVALELSEHDMIEPDLLIVLAEELGKVRRKNIEGPPSLVVEILSPSSRTHDRRRKFELYERARVPEYWIVDPYAETVEQYELQDSSYVLLGTQTEQIQFLALPDVEVDLTRVWRREKYC